MFTKTFWILNKDFFFSQVDCIFLFYCHTLEEHGVQRSFVATVRLWLTLFPMSFLWTLKNWEPVALWSLEINYEMISARSQIVCGLKSSAEQEVGSQILDNTWMFWTDSEFHWSQEIMSVSVMPADSHLAKNTHRAFTHARFAIPALTPTYAVISNNFSSEEFLF